jgi:hypothetical protein
MILRSSVIVIVIVVVVVVDIASHSDCRATQKSVDTHIGIIMLLLGIGLMVPLYMG